MNMNIGFALAECHCDTASRGRSKPLPPKSFTVTSVGPNFCSQATLKYLSSSPNSPDICEILALALSPERQSARMSEIKNVG